VIGDRKRIRFGGGASDSSELSLQSLAITIGRTAFTGVEIVLGRRSITELHDAGLFLDVLRHFDFEC
jgi:hypothetical protein